MFVVLMLRFFLHSTFSLAAPGVSSSHICAQERGISTRGAAIPFLP